MSFLSDPPIHDFPDRAIRRALEHPDNLRDLLQAAAPDLTARLDFSRLRPVKRDFLLEDWRGRESDLLFEAPFRAEGIEQPVLVCVLLEHQSQPDPRMPLRILLYAALYWERQWKEYEAAHEPGTSLQLTPLVPVIFHTASRPWSTNRTLADLLQPPAELRPFMPELRLLFFDLAGQTAEQLLGAEGFFLRLLAIVRDEDADASRFHDVYCRAVQELEPLAPQDKMRWYDLLWMAVSWVLQRRPKAERDALLTAAAASQRDLALRSEVTAMNRTVEKSWAEDLRDQLREELQIQLREQLEKQLREQLEKQLREEAQQKLQQEREQLHRELREEAQKELQQEREELQEQWRERLEAQGELRTLRSTLTSLLTDRFGSLPEPVLQQIASCADTDRLKAAVRQVLHMKSLEELQL